MIAIACALQAVTFEVSLAEPESQALVIKGTLNETESPEQTAETNASTQPDGAGPAEPTPAPPVTSGPAVRVENLISGSGASDSSKVKFVAPFPAKPMSPAPGGWRFEVSTDVPPFIREVEISPGTKIPLTIHPHLLVPDSDGAETFSISEPGYESALGYQQANTVGAILSQSMRQMESDSQKLSAAVERLQQLLSSLPEVENRPQTTPAPSTKR